MSADGAKGQGTEHRREARTPTAVRPGYNLSLRLASRRRTPVSALLNVSASGASVSLGSAVKPGSEVSLILAMDGLQLEFMAVVAWCRREEAAAQGRAGASAATHVAGLSLRGPGSFAAMLAATTVAKA